MNYGIVDYGFIGDELNGIECIIEWIIDNFAVE